MKVPDSVLRSARFQSMPAKDQLAVMRLWLIDHTECFEKCGEDCPAPVFDDEEFYDGHLDYDGDDQ